MIILGCGKAKKRYRCPAGDLYTGSLFRAAREYAEAQGGLWRILSAEHGLVHPLRVIEPYEQKLVLRGDALARWASEAAGTVERELDVPYVRVTLLMGSTYARPFRSALEALGVETFEPLAGLGLGQRLAWFKGARQALEGRGS